MGYFLNEKRNEFLTASIPNNIGLGIILLFAVEPFFGFFTHKLIDKEPTPLLVMLCILFIGFAFLEKGGLKLFSSYLLFLFLFVLYRTIQDFFIVGDSINFSYIRNNTVLGSFLILLLIREIIIPPAFYKLISKINLGVVFFAILVILIQEFYSSTFFVLDSRHSSILSTASFDRRLPSIYSWIGPSAHMGLSLFPVIGLIVEEDILENRRWRYIFLLTFGFIAAFLNKSRFMILNHVILFFLLPIHKGASLSKLVKYSLVSVALLFTFYIGTKTIGYDIDYIIENRILELNANEGTSGADTRLLAFEVFGKLFPENALFGKGMFHSFGRGEDASRDIKLMRTLAGRSSQIHVGYLSLFYYYGLIGGGFFILFMISFTVKLYKDALLTKRYAPLLAWVMFFLTNWTGVYFQIFLMGLILCFFSNEYHVSRYHIEKANA